MSPLLLSFKEFLPKYSLCKKNSPKTDANLAPKHQFLGFFFFLVLLSFKEFLPKYSLCKKNYPKTDANLAPKHQFLGGFFGQKHTLG